MAHDSPSELRPSQEKFLTPKKQPVCLFATTLKQLPRTLLIERNLLATIEGTSLFRKRKTTMVLRSSVRIMGVLLLSLAVCAAASAQYGGGAGGSGGMSPGTSNGSGGYGSGSGKAIGIAVGAAAAAVGVALLVHHHHVVNRTEVSVVGCTQSGLDGISLKNEKDDLTYRILFPGSSLRPGERVELKGVLADKGSAPPTLRAQTLVNTYGTCDTVKTAMVHSSREKDQSAENVSH
jgi:hypothetical protein